MKKIFSLVLCLVLVIVPTSMAFASNSITQAYLVKQLSKKEALEERYNGKITSIDGTNAYLSDENLAKAESVLQLIASLSTSMGATKVSYRSNPDGTFYYNWVTPVDKKIILDNGKVVEISDGTLTVAGNVTKATRNGLAYLSGSVTEAVLAGNIGLTSQRFISGNLNISNNGSKAPSVNPSATLYLEANLLFMLVSGTVTLNSNHVVFFVPET